MGSGLGGLFKKLESFGKSLSDRKENDSKQKEDNEPPHEPKTVNDLLRDFLGAFQQAFAMIDKGAKPEIDQLEMKRSKLIQALAPTKFGMECPNLQRFLRSTAVELISSLKSDSVSADDLKSFWDSKLALFEDVQNELETTLSGKEAAFWDSTV